MRSDIDYSKLDHMRVEDDAVQQIEMLRAQISKLETDLSTANSQIRTLLDAVNVFALRIVIADENGIILAHKGLADLSLESGAGRNRVGEAVHMVLKVAAASHNRADQTVQIAGPPLRTVSISGFPILSEDKNFVGGIAVVRDVRERDDVDTGLQDFVANLSHELKTPIGALSLLSETLLMERDPEVTERLVRRMNSETTRVGQVIEDLLNLSRMEASISDEFKVLSARSIVESAVNRVRYTAEHRHISISVRGDVAATLYGADRELISAVHHLLENALKYSAENSSVDVSVHTDNDWTEIAINDHGVGIAAPYLDRIFERFYRVDDARTRMTGGTGLGLSIVHRVVRNHGGEVQVASEEGKGSTFTLRLAARPSQDGVRPKRGTNG